jgi:hypothetical protein
VSRTTALSTGGFSSANHSNAALCQEQQLFPLTILAALLTTRQRCATENSRFHVRCCRSLLSPPSPSFSRIYGREGGSFYECFLHKRMCKNKSVFNKFLAKFLRHIELFLFISVRRIFEVPNGWHLLYFINNLFSVE